MESGNDGTFDKGDYILFYGKGQHVWNWDNSKFTHEVNQYSDSSYYFLTISESKGKRISQSSLLSTFDIETSSFTDYSYYEKDEINLIKSGRTWLGEKFGAVTHYSFKFNFPNIDVSSSGTIRSSYVARSTNGFVSFIDSVNGEYVSTTAVGNVQSIDYADYGRQVVKTSIFQPKNSLLNLGLFFNKGSNPNALGWLDYIEVTVRRQLKMGGGQMAFRDEKVLNQGNVKYKLSNITNETKVWDITNPLEPSFPKANITGNVVDFIASGDSLREFIAFDESFAFIPKFEGAVQNQNLHGLPQAELLIVAHPNFYSSALELANWHKEKDNMTVNLVTTEQVYNEFSSGSPDITAIRQFVKMFYDRANGNPDAMPKYLLLFGDGSYDNKNRISGNSNYIPTYQSDDFLSPTQSYTSDDYFGLLDDYESVKTTDIVDIGIGRLPVRTVNEAQNAVNKIKAYYDLKTMKAWRNYVTFVADDQDLNDHIANSDYLANYIDVNHPDYNVEKIYFDAYLQQSSSGGQRYPQVNEAIKRRIEQGTLIMNYIGHGGELGWAHERVLEVSDINKMTNKTNLPLMVTATCEFSRYDDPQRTSAGELVLLNPDGGAISLLTTTRVVYASPNFVIAKAFFEHAFIPENGKMPRLGDLIRITKFYGPTNTVNTRNFTLLGDPAIRLAYPQYSIETTDLPDTLKALGKVTIKGFVKDETGNKMTDYNGTLYPTVFDKAINIQTLANDGGSKFSFKLQKNVVFKGKASVKNGDFAFTFIVPKDINYLIDKGKISYYSENGAVDANGYSSDFVIGGSDSTSQKDETPPKINLYMNNDKFVYGGVTDENPQLYALLFDDNGFNSTGSGIGHDMVAVLDRKTEEPIILNDYYEADLDSYQSGKIKYPFSKLSNGVHTLTLSAWDVHNNIGEAEVEFVVAESANLALKHILNYPNPFSTNTGFFFEHNQPGQNLHVSVQIFTVSGKIVRTIDSYELSNGYRVGPIGWDGLDDFGDKIGNGVYVYKLKVTSPSGESVNKFEKLVILN